MSSVASGVGRLVGATHGVDVGAGVTVDRAVETIKGFGVGVGLTEAIPKAVARGVGVSVGCETTVDASSLSPSKSSNTPITLRITPPTKKNGITHSSFQKLHPLLGCPGGCGGGGANVGGRLGGCGGRRPFVAVRVRVVDRRPLPSLHAQQVHAGGCPPPQFGLFATPSNPQKSAMHYNWVLIPNAKRLF